MVERTEGKGGKLDLRDSGEGPRRWGLQAHRNLFLRDETGRCLCFMTWLLLSNMFTEYSINF